MTISTVGSDLAVHAGEVLAEELAARRMTPRALAGALGRSPQVVNEIVRGKKFVTAETALGLERALGIPARVWLNLQVEYELVRARTQQRKGA